ncbi:MAG: hypothetical protein RLZ10_889, partial [Bacteroidota bacterium]
AVFQIFPPVFELAYPYYKTSEEREIALSHIEY